MNETLGKIPIGVRMGCANLVTVFFGLYAVKNVNIPMFLAFRRCTLITTAITSMIVSRVFPDMNLTICLVFTLVGAIMAGVSFDSS